MTQTIKTITHTVYRKEKDDSLDPANLLPFTKEIGENPIGHAITGIRRILYGPYEGPNPASRSRVLSVNNG